MNAAESVLNLLFKKVHPLLEDAAHALEKAAPASTLEKLHVKLLRARIASVEALETLAEGVEDEALQEALDELASNLTPSGETFQQSLVLTQLCLEDAPDTFLPFLGQEDVDSASWMKRLKTFQELIQNPAQRAESRWSGVDPDLGEEDEDEDDG